ncbi:hypothetical protein AXF42_Ash019309 [Apostasia shenzhenica]|uniref:MICOS complex subunit MIC60 n=1 Tax=Apostasia shenzhenica TaxID=1088818 RepID=A0A2I0ARA4_9ASPA|nr:hypothetical protein AXF42_Ash019309 [Apostasia shenzhenica]
MLRRCAWNLSYRQALWRRHRSMLAQSFFLSPRSEFSSAAQKNSTPKPVHGDGTSKSASKLPLLVFGSVVAGASIWAFYLTDYSKPHVKDDSSLKSRNLDNVKPTVDSKQSIDKEIPIYEIQVKPNLDVTEKKTNNNSDDLSINTEVASEAKTIVKKLTPNKEEEPSHLVENVTLVPSEKTIDSKSLSEGNLRKDSVTTYIKPGQEESEKTEGFIEQKDDSMYSADHLKEPVSNMSDSCLEVLTHKEQDSQDSETRVGKSLVESYSLPVNKESSKDSGRAEDIHGTERSFHDKEAFVTHFDDKKRTNDGMLVLDLIEAIHAAERKQAESDANVFTEEKRRLKERYEKELKDARARELMYAEEAAILDKELIKEKAKAAATLKLNQELSEQKLREELQRKDEEGVVQLAKVQDLAKAELAAAIAKEKSSQLEKIAEANLNINALCMAFYARSEEARQTHAVHKLALGTLALEDALSNGLPFRPEVDALYRSLEGIDRESLLGLALSSIPADTVNQGIDTPLQLTQMFHRLKGTLRHFSLIPAGGGGLLTHAVAYIASSIKIREDASSDGIESLISKVESYLAESKYSEAADSLEQGVRGSEAEEFVSEWVVKARNRAVVEQAVSLLRSYAASITFE